MKRSTVINSISVKVSLLFSGVLLILLLILGSILYGVFTNLFVDFVTNDLLVRGSNHAIVLEDDYSGKMIEHVLSMEKGGSTHVLITDKNRNILGSSVPPDQEMKKSILNANKKQINLIVNNDWKRDKYITTVSSIGKNKGSIYMFYPSNVLRETVFVLKMLIFVTSIGTVFLGFGLIGFLSSKLTKPLLIMKDATNRIASGKYRQKIMTKGNDEIAQLSNAIQSLGEQLQFYEDTRNEFLSAVSHELRTPLTYIKGYSDVLSKGIIKNKEKQIEYLTIINKEAKRIVFLVDDLFEMSKLQSGKFQLEKEMADINSIIEKVTSTLRPAAEKKGLLFRKSLSAQIPPISLDVQRMEQVVYNLIENAIKYTDSGKIQIISYLQNKFVVIEINDSGIGISQQEISKIWDRFYRIEKSRARKTGGTGLGLYIAKQIIDSHDGQIRVKSIENQGSTFSIYLPEK
jgi:two-component system sensor histidine kinase BaeS